MTKRDVLSISFKILGVVALMYTIVLIPNIGMSIGWLFQPIIDSTQSYFRFWQFAIALMWGVGSLTMGLVLLKWGNNITNVLIKEDKPIATKVPQDWDKRIYKISLKIIGVIWLIKGIPELAKAITGVIVSWGIYHYTLSHIISVLVSAIVSLVVGFYLITNGRLFIQLAFQERTETFKKKKPKRKLCKHCGKRLDMDVKVCSHCGTKLSEDDVTYI